MPDIPETVMSEGYGEPFPTLGIVTAVAFAKVAGVQAAVAVGVGVFVFVLVAVAVFVGVNVLVEVGVETGSFSSAPIS